MNGAFIQASSRDRVVAFLYDYLLILVYLIALSAVGSFLTFGPFADAWSRVVSSPLRADLLAFATTVLPVILYFAVSESSQGATWGKRKVGLNVVQSDGRHLSKTRAFARSALKFLPWQLSHTAMFHIPGFPMNPGDPPRWTLFVLTAAWTLVAINLFGLTSIARGRTLYDRVVGATVLNHRSAND